MNVIWKTINLKVLKTHLFASNNNETRQPPFNMTTPPTPPHPRLAHHARLDLAGGGTHPFGLVLPVVLLPWCFSEE